MVKKSTVNAANNYTKPGMRKKVVASVKAVSSGGKICKKFSNTLPS